MISNEAAISAMTHRAVILVVTDDTAPGIRVGSEPIPLPIGISRNG